MRRKYKQDLIYIVNDIKGMFSEIPIETNYESIEDITKPAPFKEKVVRENQPRFAICMNIMPVTTKIKELYEPHSKVKLEENESACKRYNFVEYLRQNDKKLFYKEIRQSNTRLDKICLEMIEHLMGKIFDLQQSHNDDEPLMCQKYQFIDFFIEFSKLFGMESNENESSGFWKKVLI